MIYAPRGECLRFVGVVVVAVTRNRGRAPLSDSILTHGAPPDESDLRIVRRIIEAAIWYTLSEHVEIPLPPELMA